MEQVEPTSRCQVCFVISFPAEERRRLLKCIKCNQFAHSYCYLPSCKTSFFTCDPCEKGSKEERCFICEQRGLLKRVGERFAHPICMLFNPSFLVRSFRDLSFIQIESLRPKAKLKCAECAVTNGYVMNCGLKCPSACHTYCAFKSNERAESEGGSWRACFGLSHGSSTFSELFETMIFKGLSYQHSKPVKSLLSLGKQAKKVAATTIQLYCRDHSATLIECRCNEIESEKDRWIYCDCCCRWQHTECLENQKEAEEAISDENQKFYCLECKVWTKMTLQTHLDIPQDLPKLQIYDYVFIQLYLEANKFQVSLPLHEFVFRLPVFPGKEYVEQVYRKKIASILLDKVSLEGQIKALFNAKGSSSEGGLTEGLIKILDQSKDKLVLTWILCKENLFQSNEGRISEFYKKLGRQLYKEGNLKIVVDLIIDFDSKFKNGNFREIRQISSLLEGNPTVKGELVPRQGGSKPKPSKSVKLQKPLAALNDKLRKLIAMARQNSSKESVLQIMGQVHALINSPQIMAYHKDLPKIPIVSASIMFKDKESAIRYVLVMTHLQYLRGEWEKLMGSKCQDRQAFSAKKRRLLAEAEKYYDRHIMEEENDKLKEELMKEWARNEASELIPSRELAMTEPTEIIPNVNFNNLSLRKVSESLEKYTQDFLANSHKKEGFTYIKELTLMQKFLNQLETLRFTKKSLFKIKELSRQSWSGEYLDFIPKILSDFLKLYEATERLLSEECHRVKEQVCLFEQWKEAGLEAGLEARFDEEGVERYLAYFKEIDGVKTHRFSRETHGTIRGKFTMLLERVEERSQFFRNEAEYKLMSKWCTALKIVPRRMGEIFKKDRDFQQAFLFLKPQFDNIEATQKLDALVTEHFHYCKSKEIPFRVHQMQVLLTWIDLHKAVLNRVPAPLLLSEQQAQCFESQAKAKPDYYALRELLVIMRQTKFPTCLFLSRFEKIVSEGAEHCRSINRVFECCSWGYDLSASLDWDNKIEREEFEAIRKGLKECGFYFQAELIELEIIREKFQEAERQAQMLKLESEKRAERDYLQNKARSLLVSFGCFPIASKWSKFLWGLLENQKIPGLPENLEGYIADIEKSQRLHSWQELDNLREVIDCKLEGKYQKKNYCNKLSLLIASNKELHRKSRPFLEKYHYKTLFSESDMEGIKGVVSEYLEMQFEDEEIVMLQLKHEHYLAVISQMKWRQNFKITDLKKLKFLEHTASTLHASFLTPEVEKYLAYIKDQLRIAEEEKRLEEESKINYYNNAARKNTAYTHRNNSPRPIAEPTNNRRDKRSNDRNSPLHLNAPKPKSNQRRESRY